MSHLKIRSTFLDFFKARNHHIVPPSSLINKDDPTLLFTNAGMNQFKHLFTEHQQAPHKRITNIQPCLRVSGKHNDLEEVGIDTYHHTLFEMMGTWSFGDYFKSHAIEWAWQLLTQVYRIPADRLYVTVFGGDEAEKLAADQESLTIWKQYIDPSRILYGSKRDNFWEMGDAGPCGPCSEIHVDMRPLGERQKITGVELVNTGHPLVLEIWNLVFMEYNRSKEGQLVALPAKHVDTGMGLERLAMILQDKESTYDTDIFIPLTHNIMRLTGKMQGKNQQTDTAIRVIADHIRATTFAIAEGQSPSNTMAGYVIRRIIRRAIRYGHKYLDVHTPLLHELVSIIAQQYLYIYPHIKQQHEYIQQTVKHEEEAFLKILQNGADRLEHLIQGLKSNNQNIIDGETAFELYDTHGIPLDFIQMIASEKNIQVDEPSFQQYLQAQRDRSRKSPAIVPGEWCTIQPIPHSHFVGYEQLQVITQLVQYRSNQHKKHEEHQVVLEETPFYPEGGGQVGDTGHLIIGEQMLTVLDTQKEGDRIIHYLPSLPNSLHKVVKAVVDKQRRLLIANNHTATHLLQAALRQVLGPHVEQKGSWVGPDFLRFDFLHDKKLTAAELQAVEQIVNQKIRETIPLQEDRDIPLEKAKALGATALFSEKYASHVRLISIGNDFSKELCGGTHAENTGKLGYFIITLQSSVAAGIRRIEAVTSAAAEKFIHQQHDTLQQISDILKTNKEPIKSLQNLMTQRSELDKKLQQYQAKIVQDIKQQMLGNAILPINGINAIIEEIKVPDEIILKQLARQLINHTTPLFITLVACMDGKPHLVIAIDDRLTSCTSLQANALFHRLASHIKGDGGGQVSLAMGKGEDASGIPQLLLEAKQVLKELTGKQR